MPEEVQQAISRINAGNPQPGDHEIAQQWLFQGSSPKVQPMQGNRGPTEADTTRLQMGGGIDTPTTGPARQPQQPPSAPQDSTGQQALKTAVQQGAVSTQEAAGIAEGGISQQEVAMLLGRLNDRLKAVETQQPDMSFSLQEAQQAQQQTQEPVESDRDPEASGLGGVPEEVRQTLLRAGVPEQVATDRALQVARMEQDGIVFDAKTFVTALERGASPRDAFFEGMGSADRFDDKQQAEDAIAENFGFISLSDVMVPEQGGFAQQSRQREQARRLGDRTEELKRRVESRRAMRQGAPLVNSAQGTRPAQGTASPQARPTETSEK